MCSVLYAANILKLIHVACRVFLQAQACATLTNENGYDAMYTANISLPVSLQLSTVIADYILSKQPKQGILGGLPNTILNENVSQLWSDGPEEKALQIPASFEEQLQRTSRILPT